MSQPFTDEEMMIIAQLSYKDPYIRAKGYELSLFKMLDHEKDYLIAALGKDKEEIIEGLIKKVDGQHYYIVDSTNDKHGTGFAALAIEGPDSKTVTFACRGTEGFSFDYDSTKDVKADAQLGFEAETAQQRQMNNFMKQFESYDSIYLTGHSLGGNLAISGAIGFGYPEKIKGVVTFNCPGQNTEFIVKNEKKIKLLHKKIKNYQNEHDRVSDVNLPIGSVLVIKSNNKDSSFGDGFNYDHLQKGFDVSKGNGFTVVEGNKKSADHTVFSEALNTLILMFDKFTNIEIFVYALLNLVELYNITLEKIEKIKQWWKVNYNAGYKHATANPQISVDTYKLRDYAQRLQRINGRISRVDGRLDSLYWKVGLLDLWKLMQADILTGYSWRLNRCASYLNDTASDFENVESALLNNL